MNYRKRSKATIGTPAIALTMVAVLLAGAAVQAAAQTATEVDGSAPTVVHNTWSSGTAMPLALEFTMAGVLTSKVGGVLTSQIYVVGGVTTSAVVANNQIYNPVAKTWSRAAAIPMPTFDGAVVVMKNVLYIFGGSNDGSTCTNAVWAYNPKTNSWSAKAAMPTSRCSAAASVENNIIYVIGGVTPPSMRLNTVESYNPATNTWTEEAPLLVGKSEASVGLVKVSVGGKIVQTIIAADGYTASGDTGDNEGYNATANSWKSLASDPTVRHEACTGSIGGKLYLAGGSNNQGTSLTVTESFNLSKNKWTTQASMPQAVTGTGSVVNKGLLYCFGGGDRNSQFQGNVFNYVQIYQP